MRGPDPPEDARGHEVSGLEWDQAISSTPATAPEGVEAQMCARFPLADLRRTPVTLARSLRSREPCCSRSRWRRGSSSWMADVDLGANGRTGSVRTCRRGLLRW